MSGESPHVSVEDLASGSLAAPARAHLQECATCQKEAQVWAATRDAVSLMIAESRPPDVLIDDVLAHVDGESVPDRIAWRSGSGLRRVRRQRRGRLLASAAAFLVLAGGVGYGISALAGSSGRVAVQPAAVTVVAGCSGLESVTGTLQTVEGSTLLIRAADGSMVRVAIGAVTHTMRQQPASLAETGDATPVIVTGTYSDGSLKATNVGQLSAVPSALAPVDAAKMLRQGQALGTVSDLQPGGFTVVEAGGTRVAVTTSSSTTVTAAVSTEPGRLQIGARTAVVGRSGPNGTLVASSVDQQAPPLHLVGPPTAAFPGTSGIPPSGAKRSRSPLAGLGCDPATIATTALIQAG